MGCQCCKIQRPKDYAACKVANKKPFGKWYLAPCGMTFSPQERGSNYTPPKKRKKRKK
nr:MAG TPA: hypothetical protein [Caudoviricetes sp.]